MEGALGGGNVAWTIIRLFADPAMWTLAFLRARAEAMTWTPGLILDYTQTLQHVLNGDRRRWFTRLKLTHDAVRVP